MASQVQELRQQIRVLQRRANNKISRLEGQGVKVRYSEFDIRRDLAKVDKYNTRQLRAYARQLEQFNSRQNSFLSGAEGAPIPSREWSRYKGVEGRYNRAVQRRMEKFGDIHIVESGMTVREREATIVPNRRSASRGSAVDRPYIEVTREDPSRITGARALRELTQDLRQRLTKRYERDAILAQQFQATQISDRLGDPELTKQIAGLSPRQFEVLWNHTSFATDAAEKYAAILAAFQRGYEPEADDYSDLYRQVEWARGLDL